LDLSGVKQEKTGAGLKTLTRLPPELERLTSLQKLNINGCYQLNDISLLARLPSNESLDLSHCEQLRRTLTPLASLTDKLANTAAGTAGQGIDRPQRADS
jgi:Leucine-rich repeat (LRR) protein